MNVRILIVDDEEEFTTQLAERLSLRGYYVSTCFSGEEAVETVKGYNYDVVILDVLMSGIDGVEALKQLKEINPLLEIIMLTGNATVESAIEGMKLGAFDYLMKPTKTDELIGKVNKAYARKAEQEERIRQAKVNEIISSPRSVFKDDKDDN